MRPLSCAVAWMLLWQGFSLGPATALAQTRPLWRTEIVPWTRDADRPWRRDQRLTAHFEPNHRDDVLVVFASPDSLKGVMHEAMWVRVIAYDAPSDQYLGILLNTPNWLQSVGRGDNVVFRADREGDYPRAVQEDGSYRRPGWPGDGATPFVRALIAGIVAYRMTNDGHDTASVTKCIDTLKPLMRSPPPAATADERFVGHYVFGRCLAERYVTDDAIAQFRTAIGLDSTDADAHMALLAELSVKAHQVPANEPAEATRWDQALLTQLALVRERFWNDAAVRSAVTLILDPSHEAMVRPEHASQLPRFRRIGYVVLRWKRR